MSNNNQHTTINFDKRNIAKNKNTIKNPSSQTIHKYRRRLKNKKKNFY